MSPISELDSGVPVFVDLVGEEKTLALVSSQTKSDRKSSPVKSLIKRGFFGPRAASPPTVVADVLLDMECELIRRGSLFVGVADLDRSLSQLVSSTFVISKSQLGNFQRVKDKVAKQLNKNKEMLAKVVIDNPEEGAEEYSKEVHRTMKMASVVGMTWGGDDKKMLDLLSARERKAKGMRELKNLDCSVSPVKSQRSRGRVGSKYAITFPPEVH